ncbi:hypothetical protein GOV04_00195 [Candidatus Woesearchaeota archaeon]|nr:hypothetical protein [Candidatus Woesearchaeota archaeon]
MCFAPYISMSTFVIEFLLAFYFLMRSPKDKLNRIIAALTFLLGFYQLNEFLICTTQLTVFTRLALSTTAILPALGVSMALIMWRKKLSKYWTALIYSPALFFIVMFSINKQYSNPTTCDTVFIQYPAIGILGEFFALYYAIYVLGTIILFYFAAHNTKIKGEPGLFNLGMLSMLVFTVPTGIFLIFLPMFYVQFASVLCEFALLTTINFIILLWYKDKYNLKY